MSTHNKNQDPSEQNWQNIWNRKDLDTSLDSTLAQLIAVDGFSSPFGRMGDTRIWQDYVAMQAQRLGVAAGDTLYEVGCGGGAFLYPFWQRGHRVAGLDYAAKLVAIAQGAMPDAQLIAAEAKDIPSTAQADVVVANGVFLYFASEDYAAEVLRKMVAAARKSVGVFDVCDLAKHAEAIAARKAVMGDAEYAERYRGLDQLYLDRSWFARVLSDLPVRVETADQQMEGYGNAAFRYNVYIYK